MSVSKSIVVLGGSGFVGGAVVEAAVTSGLRVVALARSDTAAATLTALGASVVRGDVGSPAAWIAECVGADAIIDLTQPPVPARLTVGAINRMATQRVAATRAVLAALRTLPERARPLWISVNGTDDLAPDSSGMLSGRSSLRASPHGFAHIGLPVRATIQSTGVDAAYVYLGQMVYGPGKVYANFVVDGIRTGRAKMIGSGRNSLPLTHVEDVARALVHLIGLGRDELVGRTIVAVPATPATQHDLFDITAQALGRPTPGRVPNLLAALAAGRVNAQVMTLDATCEPDLLTASGFTFRHETLQSGIHATLAALPR